MDDLTGGVLAAFGAMLVAGFVWLARNGFITAVRQQFEPLSKKLEQHMENEETARTEQLSVNESILDKLDEIGEQFKANELDHAEFRGRFDRLEGGG